LADEVAALREALDSRAKAAKRLAELDRAEDREERRRAVDAAQKTYDDAKSRSEALRAVEAELRLARDQHDGAQKELGTFRAAAARAEALQDSLAEAERKRAEAISRRAAAAAALTKAHADSEAADKDEREARTLLARLDAALKARDAAQRLTNLEQTLAAAEAMRTRIARHGDRQTQGGRRGRASVGRHLIRAARSGRQPRWRAAER
jgi:DNA repair exonuclease SbcCD ATPase subunit